MTAKKAVFSVKPIQYAVYKTLGLNTTGIDEHDHYKNGFIGIYDNKEEAFAAALIVEFEQFDRGHVDEAQDDVDELIWSCQLDRLHEYFVEN